MSQLLDQGKAALNHGSYDEAVKYFSKALMLSKVSTEAQLKVLDLRCQAYFKLGKQELALQDARHMIRIGKRHAPTGYLRCSQLERHSGNYATAIRWLEHGLKNVPRAQSILSGQLKKVQDLARKHTCCQKRQDPIASMPLEILQIILRHLNYQETVRLLRVSRAWRDVLSRIQPLNTDIDFSHSRTKVSSRSLNAALRRLSRRPRKIVLGSLMPPATNAAQSWLAKFTNLETLEILQVHESDLSLQTIRFDRLEKLKCLCIGKAQKLSLNKVFSVIATCQTLQMVNVYGISMDTTPTTPLEFTQTQLTHLTLHGEQASYFRLPPTLATWFPGLQGLSVRGGIVQPPLLEMSSHQRLQQLQLELVAQGDIEMRLPPSTQELDCRLVYPCVMGWDCILSETTKMPNLQKMAFRGSRATTMISALSKMDCPPRLQSAVFEHVTQDELHRLSCRESEIFKDCSEISFLSHEMTDYGSVHFVNLFPHIESIILETPLITGVFIADLVNKSQRSIKEITLRNCAKVSSDIAEWLEARGVAYRVVNRSDDLNSGRRVRGA